MRNLLLLVFISFAWANSKWVVDVGHNLNYREFCSEYELECPNIWHDGFSVTYPGDPENIRFFLTTFFNVSGDSIIIEVDFEILLQSVQENAPPNLAFLSNSSNTFEYIFSGKGVNVYVVDQAVRIHHRDFKWKKDSQPFAIPTPVNFCENDDYCCSENWWKSRRACIEITTYPSEKESCKDHGTHVAAIAGGLMYGAAKNAIIRSVQVQPCDGGLLSYMIDGLKWISRYGIKPAVVQMSLVLIGNTSRILSRAIHELYENGILCVVSAGNYAMDACDFSPVNEEVVLGVGNIDVDGKVYVESNFGKCVNIYAPGVNIISAFGNSDTATGSMTGTSQSAPLVSGVVAQFLQYIPSARPDDIKKGIVANSSELRLFKDVSIQSSKEYIDISPSEFTMYGFDIGDNDNYTLIVTNLGQTIISANVSLPIWLESDTDHIQLYPRKIAFINVRMLDRVLGRYNGEISIGGKFRSQVIGIVLCRRENPQLRVRFGFSYMFNGTLISEFQFDSPMDPFQISNTTLNAGHHPYVINAYDYCGNFNVTVTSNTDIICLKIQDVRDYTNALFPATRQCFTQLLNLYAPFALSVSDNTYPIFRDAQFLVMTTFAPDLNNTEFFSQEARLEVFPRKDKYLVVGTVNWNFVGTVTVHENRYNSTITIQRDPSTHFPLLPTLN